MSAMHIAWFISAHGFGHAARAGAVMAALRHFHPGVRFHVYTSVPAWFFEDPAIAPVVLRRVETDVGVVQDTPLAENPGETLRRLNAFFPLSDSAIRGLADELAQKEVSLVVADIAPLGIAVATMAGIPSVLIENFTWDWIYAPYVGRWPGFEHHIAYLGKLFDGVGVRIQTVPVCRPVACHLTAAPISREARAPVSAIRASLGIPDGKYMVLLSLGGTPVSQGALSALRVPEGFRIVAPGGPECLANVHRVVRLPTHSPYYHPDLIRAADAVVGKAGYSTMAEIYRYGTPFGFVSRPDFREAPVMEAFIKEEMGGCRVPSSVFECGDWGGFLADLVAMPARTAPVENGADTVARFLTARFGDGPGIVVSDG